MCTIILGGDAPGARTEAAPARAPLMSRSTLASAELAHDSRTSRRGCLLTTVSPPFCSQRMRLAEERIHPSCLFLLCGPGLFRLWPLPCVCVSSCLAGLSSPETLEMRRYVMHAPQGTAFRLQRVTKKGMQRIEVLWGSLAGMTARGLDGNAAQPIDCPAEHLHASQSAHLTLSMLPADAHFTNSFAARKP